MSDPITIFLVDDHELARAGMRSLIDGRFAIVGEADNADSAIELIGERLPDVVLLDVHLPGGGGQRVAIEVSEAHPEVAMLAVSASDDPQDVGAVVGAGASGYLLKTAPRERLIEAIEQTAAGHAYFSPALAGYILEEMPDAAGIDEEVRSLTEREREVLRLIARGYTYREIGEHLFISVKTVETHVSHVLRKLHLVNRYQLAKYARERKLD
ncbi:MAG TPA: response regulator transcription factor [Acidimicrobiia bacterium]|nr:response regulator transcription factor [Acidimicrobiia bacterium]